MNQKEIVFDHLKAMGFEPIELDDVGYVFKYEDTDFLYMTDDDDEQFLRIVIPFLFEVTDENRAAVLEAMHDTVSLLKYAKMYIMDGTNVWAVYEHRLSAADDLSDLLEHIIRVLEAAAHVFHKKINGEEVLDSFDEADDSSDDELEAELQKVLDGSDEDKTED